MVGLTSCLPSMIVTKLAQDARAHCSAHWAYTRRYVGLCRPTLRSTGRAGTCFDLRSHRRGAPVTLNVRARSATPKTMLRPAIVSTLLPSVVSAARNSGTSQRCRCRVSFAACASGSAARGPPHHQRAAEHRRAFGLRPAVGRCAASVPRTSFAGMPVAHGSQRCVGGTRCVRRSPSPCNAFFQHSSRHIAQLWPRVSIRGNTRSRACASWTRFEP
jgi:hypothetical protein